MDTYIRNRDAFEVGAAAPGSLDSGRPFFGASAARRVRTLPDAQLAPSPCMRRPAGAGPTYRGTMWAIPYPSTFDEPDCEDEAMGKKD